MTAKLATVSFRTETGVAKDESWTVVDSAELSNTAPWRTFRSYKGQNALLTTQEAAEFLGISRPTLVRLLEDREIAHEKRGRHRRVLLSDLLSYQERMRRERRESLTRMAREGQEAGIYEATSGPPPRTR